MTSLRALMQQVDATNAALNVQLGAPGAVCARRMIPGGWRIAQLDENYELQFVSDYLTREDATEFLVRLQKATPAYRREHRATPRVENYYDDGEAPDWGAVIRPENGDREAARV